MIVYWLIALVCIAVAYWYLSIPKNLPPGPFGLPFIGSWLDFSDGSDQHAVLQRYAKRYGPVYSFYVTNKLFIVLSEYDSIYEALVRQGDIFSGKYRTFGNLPQPFLTLGVSTGEGDHWAQLRRSVLSILRDFGFGRPILEPLIQDEAENLVQRMLDRNGAPFDPARMIAQAVLNVLFQLAFGRPCENQEIVDSFVVDSEKKAGIGEGFVSPFVASRVLSYMGALFPSVRRTRRGLAYFNDMLEKELLETKSAFDPTCEPTNYVHAFMKASMEPGRQDYLNDTTLCITTCMDLISTGAEAVAGVLYHTFKHIHIDVELQNRLADHVRKVSGPKASLSYSDRSAMPLLEATVMEGLRISDLAPVGTIRRTNEPTKLLGYDIPKHAITLPLLTNVLNNPDYYPNPERFEPERFLAEDGSARKDPKLIPFQMGKRICIAETMSKMMIFIFIGTICNRVRLVCPPGKPRPDMTPVVIASVGGNTTVAKPYDICVQVRK